ncbi:DUF3604 domain-containing protein [uncultured Pseudoteredinibacter sp.]|uniref:DUF3604 domain-containing protein n=1 Tax=uncultured Pseudoteredinibacter sp. TaxID=1641701 RepID=UPI00262F2499|nr:DUF3604 domain-containing protein [uncultured Pseudoteredinibacter sp.]
MIKKNIKASKALNGLLGTIGLAAALGNGQAMAEEKQVYWGDTHLHSSYSFDAYLFRNHTADPDTAYRYAKGYPVVHPFHRGRVQIETPLDFLVVSDHAEMMGVVRGLGRGEKVLADIPIAQKYMGWMKEGRARDVFSELVAGANSGERPEGITALSADNVRKTMWGEIVDATERHNEPGKFTTLVGWEWSAMNKGANLHRIVLTSAGADKAKQFLPYSSIDSWKAEDLWQWMADTSKDLSIDMISIPHNPNISKGEMFNNVDSDGRPLTAEYARTRMRFEPVIEMTQIKGDSETHPLLSPNDEFADYETYRFLIDTRPDVDKTAPVNAGSYMRSALQRGMKTESEIGVNPYKFGVIGSTDAHTGLASAEENNFHGKMALDGTPSGKNAMRVGKKGASGWDMAAQGLAAVWAPENTRDAIMAAFQRREVYATTGPRIKLQLFAGWNFKKRDAESKAFAKIGQRKGVPMGGDLSAAPKRKAPSFIVRAVKDPKSANLDRVQMVKSYIDAKGNSQEEIYNIALSNGRNLKDPKALTNTVDAKSASYRNTVGEKEFAVYWKDPDFDPKQRAVYYVRVLEIATPRHTTFDKVALGEKIDVAKASIQERAYSSPVWYTP